MDKVYLSWSDVEELVQTLAQSVDDHLEGVKFIHGLERGGMIPAVMLSHLLNIPYTHQPHYHQTECLIVDDICDSGETLTKWRDHSTAVLHYKPHTSCYTPTIWVTTHDTDSWIIYPWEDRNSKTIQDYKLHQ